MTKKELQRIIEKIAKANHTTPENIRQEMQSAMEAGLSNPDPTAQAKWNAIPRKGEKPTLEELISYAIQEVSLFQS